MTDKQIVVSDDWTKNWQAKIAVKITAIFLWMVIAVTFFGLVYLNHDLESDITQDIGRDIQAVSFQVHQLLMNTPDIQGGAIPPSFIPSLKVILQGTHLTALTLTMGEQTISVGIPEAGSDSELISIDYPNLAGSGDATIMAHYPRVEELSRVQRDGMLVMTAISILAIGIILSRIIQNVLAKPFDVLINATQQVSRGNLGVRLDVSRDDEFGKLSRFFNEMLDTIKHQQDVLTRKNEELKIENTERKRAEQELKVHRDELELQVVERTRDLQDARDQALEASKTKSAFIANISHEIRTPLTPIIGFSEAMLEEQQSHEAQRHSLKTIIRNSRHLLSLINDILDLSKIEANRIEIDRVLVNPFEVLQDVDILIGSQAREKGLEYETCYEYPLPEQIHTDPLRLKQILMNLAINAVKFTDKGFVRISVAFNASSNQMTFSVVDTGIGVSKEKRERLFKAFSQADSSTTREYGGTGLGLYISQRLARMLGGILKWKASWAWGVDLY